MTSPHPTPGVNAAQALAELGATVLQRDWLSSNHIVFAGHAGGEGAAVVDTGFDSHAPLTLQLLAHALKGERLGRVLNTHMHSDHCGGNAWLQEAHRCATFVPEPSFEAVRQWDEEALTFQELDQRCRRFHTDAALVPGQALRLGEANCDIVAAPGHDPEAVMLFQPEARVLIAGRIGNSNGLWQARQARETHRWPADTGLDGLELTAATSSCRAPASP